MPTAYQPSLPARFYSFATLPSSDSEVTKYLSWPRHRCVEDAKSFLRFSAAEWERWPAGPYLVESRDDRQLLGSTGLSFESPTVATTGYVFARDAWGQGYATEALRAVARLADDLGIRQLYAICYAGHPASVRVLEKCGFLRESVLAQYAEFPNLGPGRREDCFRYVRTFDLRNQE